MVRGLIYSDPNNNVLFGPALIESYKLESEYAITPRIIISNEICRNYFGDMFSDTHYLKQNGLANRPLLRFDQNIPQDEIWFINYFWGPIANRFHQLVEHKGIEEIITNYLSLYNEFKCKEQNNDFSKNTQAKFGWCKINIHETIKDLFEWIEGFEYTHKIRKDLLNALKQEAENYLIEEVKKKPKA